jgi:hypothetical protein
MSEKQKKIDLFKDNEGIEIIKIAGKGILVAGALAVTGVALGAANTILGNKGGQPHA